MFASQTVINPGVYKTNPQSDCTVNLLIVDFTFSPILSLLSLFHMTNKSERKVFLEIRLKSLSINFCLKLYILNFDQFPYELCCILE